MQQLYRITITDAAYAHDGSAVYYIVDGDAFKAFDATARLYDVKVPPEFEDDGPQEWLYSLDVEDVSVPYICLGETLLWSNC